MSPPLSNPALCLSNCQLFHQADLILDVTSPRMSDRTRSLLPLKVPGSQPLGPPEAHVLPKPLGPLEACVLPAEACVPPKPHGPWGEPSSSKAGPSQAKYSLTHLA